MKKFIASIMLCVFALAAAGCVVQPPVGQEPWPEAPKKK